MPYTGQWTRLFPGLMLILLLAGPAAAADDLFVAETAVSDESVDNRNAALSMMLADVLIRVSGNTGVAAQPAAKPVLAAAPSLVQQYRYRTREVDGGVERLLWARFEQAEVERMMRAQGLPVWTQRPRVLMWLVSERGAQRELLNLDSMPDARAAVLARASYRGLPLQLPLMDLEDQSALTPADVWSDYQPAVRAASARYPHELIVTGRLQGESGDRWRGSWQILSRDGAQTFETPSQALADGLAFAVDQVQNLLAARYAPMPGAGGADDTTVQFADVTDLPGYARLIGLLDGLEPVAGVVLREVSDDAVTFAFRLRGSEDDLRRALDAGSEVVNDPGGAPLPRRIVGADGTVSRQAVPRADLYYRLRN